MNNKVIVVYDDTRKPSREIASITGKNSFGDTIFKRKTLKEHVFSMFENFENVGKVIDTASKDILGLFGDNQVLLLYSDFGIINVKEAETLCYKACFAHENYKITCRGKICAVIFKDTDSFKDAKVSDFDTYTDIPTDGFVDLSDGTNFKTFITSGFEARFFNSLSGDEYTLVKSSENADKLYNEYCFYGLLPDDMKQWFVRPFDFKRDGDKGSYKMQRYHMTDLAIRYVHGAIKEDEFEDILSKLFYFVNHRLAQKVSREEYEAIAEKLYIQKVSERLESLKKMPGYDKLATLIKSGTDYEDVDGIFEKYKSLYTRIRRNTEFEYKKVVGHGDMCFSNILYSYETDLLLFIDPKGAEKAEDMYMDPFYDLAKLSHSVCGHYDYFNSDLYEINFDENLKAKVFVDADNRKYVEIFKGFLEENGFDFKLVRLYEASLFLSMLPLHMDRPKKVFGFVLNAIAILDSLED